MSDDRNLISICIGVGENNIKLATETNDRLEKLGCETYLFTSDFKNTDIQKVIKEHSGELLFSFFGLCRIHWANGCCFFDICMPNFTHHMSDTLSVEDIAFFSRNYSKCLMFINSDNVIDSSYRPLRCIPTTRKRNMTLPKTIVTFNFGENPMNIEKFSKQKISIDNIISDESTLLIGKTIPIPCNYPYKFPVDIEKENQAIHRIAVQKQYPEFWSFLFRKDLEEYYDLFVAHEITTIQDFRGLDWASLTTMGLVIGDMIRIHKKIICN